MGIALVGSSGLARARLVLVLTSGLALTSSVASAQSFTGLGFMPGGTESYGKAVSNDGVVTGFGFIPPENAPTTGFRAFGWPDTYGNMVNLGTLPGGEWSAGRDVSADGSVIVGWSGPHPSDHAFRFAGGFMTDLPPLPGMAASRALGVSDDGSVIVGFSGFSTTGKAFRWTQASGMTDLGTPSGKGWVYVTANDVSGNGSVVVGYAEKSTANSTLAYRWTGGSMTTLGKLKGGSYSEAWATNSTGSVVVGESDSRNGTRAFRWTGGTMTDLGTLGGPYPYSYGRDVSGDGSMVVGYSSDGTTVTLPVSGSIKSTGHAFLWTSPTGMVDLNDSLPLEYGFDLSGWELREALGVSANGEYIVGWGMHNGSPEAWIAFLP